MNILNFRSGSRARPAFSGRCAERAVLVAMLLLIQAVPLSHPVRALADDPAPAAADLDPNFGSGGKVVTDFFGAGNQGRAVAIQQDGRIVVVGQAHTVPGHDDFALVRHNADGTLDTGFG